MVGSEETDFLHFFPRKQMITMGKAGPQLRHNIQLGWFHKKTALGTFISARAIFG